MKLREMLKRKRECNESFEKEGEGKDCKKCRLCDVVTLDMSVAESSGGPLEGAEIKLVVNPCLLLDELASKIRAK